MIPLTEKERKVAHLIMLGMSSKQAAHTMGISFSCVVGRKQAVFDKMGVVSTTAMIRVGLREHIVSVHEFLTSNVGEERKRLPTSKN